MTGNRLATQFLFRPFLFRRTVQPEDGTEILVELNDDGIVFADAD
jgi:hypothetical protein